METEIKLRVADIEAARAAIESSGYRISHPRVFEANSVFDTPDMQLRNHRCLLRVREAGDQYILTFKGPPLGGKHKSREEIETTVADASALSTIVERIGFERWFRYEKYRTEYERPEQSGVITVDETPIGVFLELEGEPGWIDTTATALGYSEPDYITSSYFTLYEIYCRERGLVRKDMVFETEHPRTA